MRCYLITLALKIVTKVIFKDFKQTFDALGRLGAGQVSNLNLKYNKTSKKETDILMRSVDDMAQKIYHLICKVKDNATLTDDTATHILKRSTEHQEANTSVTERVLSIATAVEELSASIADVSERGQKTLRMRVLPLHLSLASSSGWYNE